MLGIVDPGSYPVLQVFGGIIVLMLTAFMMLRAELSRRRGNNNTDPGGSDPDDRVRRSDLYLHGPFEMIGGELKGINESLNDYLTRYSPSAMREEFRIRISTEVITLSTEIEKLETRLRNAEIEIARTGGGTRRW